MPWYEVVSGNGGERKAFLLKQGSSWESIRIKIQQAITLRVLMLCRAIEQLVTPQHVSDEEAFAIIDRTDSLVVLNPKTAMTLLGTHGFRMAFPNYPRIHDGTIGKRPASLEKLVFTTIRKGKEGVERSYVIPDGVIYLVQPSAAQIEVDPTCDVRVKASPPKLIDSPRTIVTAPGLAVVRVPMTA